MSKTSFEKLLDDCERAYLSKYPVIFIQTDEMELVRRIVESDRLVVRFKEIHGKNLADKRLVPCTSEDKTHILSSGRDEDRQKRLNYSADKDLGESFGTMFGRIPCMSITHLRSRQEPFTRLSSIMKFVDLYTSEKDDNSAIRNSVYLLYGDTSKLPVELYEYCAIIEVHPPEISEICDLIQKAVAEYHFPVMREAIAYNLAYQLLGFSTTQIERILHAVLSMPDMDGANAIFDEAFTIRFISERKEQLLHREQLLSLVQVQSDDPEIGGMKLFKNWFASQAPCIRNAAQMKREAGIPAPRGVLMCGVPGCGKSLAAKAVARELNKPLLKMDVGNLMGSFLGESEKNMEKALRLADAMSPCVLWIDELEKGFGEAGGSGRSGDSGSFRRMFGKLLTWMQESKKPCFIFATANDITALPKEFFRSGRFDELFAIFMPLQDECVDILYSQMKRLCGSGKESREIFTPECWSRQALSGIVSQFIIKRKNAAPRECFVTGADMEKLVNIAMRSLWQKPGHIQRISSNDWEIALLNALSNTRVYGESSDTLDSIAMSYLRLLRNGMRPSSEKSLFSTDEYYTEFLDDGTVKAGFRRKSETELQSLQPYDLALYEALWRRIQDMAPIYERNSRERLLRGG